MGLEASKSMQVSFNSSEFYSLLEGAENARPDNVSPSSVNFYLQDLNLMQELAGLPTGTRVVDVGCSGGKGTEALAQVPEFSGYQFIGVTPFIIQRRINRDTSTIPIYKGRAEELSSVLRSKSAWPADVLLLRNVLEIVCLGEQKCHSPGLKSKVFSGLHSALGTNGRVLAYDQYGTGEIGISFYEEYRKIGKEIGFSVAERPCPPVRRSDPGHSNSYILMQKK